jgi:hypothetical protein
MVNACNFFLEEKRSLREKDTRYRTLSCRDAG